MQNEDPAAQEMVVKELDELARLYPPETNKYLAPNGKPSNLTREQWYYVRTRSFKEKFGDWEAAALIDMAERVWKGSKETERIYFTPSEKLKQELEKLQGKNIDTVFITDSDIRHIKNRHSQNQATHGQIDITSEDVALIPFVINEFDTAVHDETDGKGNKKLLFTKQVNGTAYVASIERGTHKEQIITLWKTKNPVHHATNSNPPLTSPTTQANTIIQKAEDLRNSLKALSVKLDANGEPFP